VDFRGCNPMHRFFSPPSASQGDELVLTGSEAHHALHVLRVAAGEDLVILNGAGEEIHCRVQRVWRRELTLAVEHRHTSPPIASRITLLQGIPRGKVMEAIVQKATELGVGRIVPLLSANAVVQLGAPEARNRLEKWRRTALEAIKQCGLVWLPEIELPQSPKEFLARGERFDLALMATLVGDHSHPRRFLQPGSATAPPAAPRSLALWIGPEGDFTPDEVAAARSAGVNPISLGPLVLRSDTAAIYCLSIVNYEMQFGAGAAH
jgi:16S rRNA (uracil1498-N3)-methyltransferase